MFLLPPYFSNVTKRLVKQPKLYFLDTGLCTYLTNWTSADALAAGAMSGAILKTYVFGEIMKSWWNQAREPSIYYYRDKDCVEIDFVIVQDQMFYPIEVKKAATPKTQWAKSFNAIRRLGKIGHGGIVCLCEEYLPLSDEISVIPVRLI